MREMGKNHSSIVVLRIWPIFLWMVPIGVRDNHTQYEPKTKHWRPGTAIASAGALIQNLQFSAKTGLCFNTKTALEPTKNGQMKGNSGFSTHAARLPSAARALQLHKMPAKRPQKAPKSPKICAHCH